MRPTRFDGHDISEAWEMEEGERHCASAVRWTQCSWLRGVDLNHRPLGYEESNGLTRRKE
jgi:hypothetical protein